MEVNIFFSFFVSGYICKLLWQIGNCTHKHFQTLLFLDHRCRFASQFPAFFSQFFFHFPPDEQLLVHDKCSLWFLGLIDLSNNKTTQNIGISQNPVIMCKQPIVFIYFYFIGILLTFELFCSVWFDFMFYLFFMLVLKVYQLLIVLYFVNV